MGATQTIENAAMTASPWEYHAALLPIRFEHTDTPDGTGNCGDFEVTPEHGRPILMLRRLRSASSG
jgi:hypothetical protein